MTLPFSYQIIRSDRKTVALQIGAGGQVLVRAPRRMSEADIRGFVESKSAWVMKHLEKRTQQAQQPPITIQQVRALADQAAKKIPERVRYFAPLIGVRYGRITIRNQTSRWGSCTGEGNLNFNCLLMLAPPRVLDYVVIHELCHRKQMNHSAAFWAEVEKIMPDYKLQRQWLKDNGGGLIRRMTGR